MDMFNFQKQISMCKTKTHSSPAVEFFLRIVSFIAALSARAPEITISHEGSPSPLNYFIKHSSVHSAVSVLCVCVCLGRRFKLLACLRAHMPNQAASIYPAVYASVWIKRVLRFIYGQFHSLEQNILFNELFLALAG